MSAIQSDYRTFKHIPSRKCYQLIMEIPEEEFANVCSVLGYPKTGENTYVGIALLDVNKHESLYTSKNECIQTEGEKLRTRAIMLCKDSNFQSFMKYNYVMAPFIEDEGAIELVVKAGLCKYCGITSRSELATSVEAQNKFKELLKEYKNWQFEQEHKDNIERI